ncbi:MAG: bifunctional diguanylate cyclase/phosphodiesterase, partial [Thermoanaerobaculia bacterium]|nr:bifunctional diguanylate cyclase/phosphodiesterase [Thermoanaerobaculia bacterium]
TLCGVEGPVVDHLPRRASPRQIRATVEAAIERHRLQNELRSAWRQHHLLSTRDVLTGLQNRSAFVDALRFAIAHADRAGERLAVLVLDLDDFAALNATAGAGVADDVLRETALRLAGAIRDSDRIARIGGDEFGVLLQKLPDERGAATLAQKLLEVVAAGHDTAAGRLRLTASAGIALHPGEASSAEALLGQAEAAGRRAARSRFRFHSTDTHSSVSSSLALESGLRRALERDELSLHYQPIRDAVSKRITGAEALLRWHDPAAGLVAPAAFIPVAEDTGLIHEVGDWVLRSACLCWAEWRHLGMPELPLSINLSTVQLASPRLPDTVAEVLAETGLAPRHLHLELSESPLLLEDATVRDTVERLADHGVRLVLDDFGTGVSSLNVLRSLPFRGVKIAQSFVAEIHRDSSEAELAAAMIQLAHTLGLRVVAEGVETPAQMALFLAHGCDEVQGHLFGPALPAADFAAILALEDAGHRDLGAASSAKV